MNTIEDDKKISNDISTSINILNEKDEEFHNDITSNLNSTNLTNEKDEVKNNVKQRDDKDDKITLEDLTKIIDEPDEKEKESENEQKKDDNTIKKEGGHLSQDEMLENEFSIIKKQNLSKYLRENNQFKSSNIESEEESHNNIHPIEPIGRKLYKFVGRTLFLFLDKFENPLSLASVCLLLWNNIINNADYIFNFMEIYRICNENYRLYMLLDIFSFLYILFFN